MEYEGIMRGRGTNKTISMSNTTKMIANKKNRVEKGIRAVWFGSNPHSKGDIFSRSIEDRVDKIRITAMITPGSRIEMLRTVDIKYIY